MSDALLLVLRINLAAGAAIALVMLLRAPVRRLFGAGAAYALWILAPLAALAMAPPARVITLVRPVAPQGAARVWSDAFAAMPQAFQPGLGWSHLLTGLWVLGGALSLGYLAGQQTRFSRAVRAGRGGPAVIGVLRPRIVTPADFARRYTAREQMVVLTHEATHIARHDSRINAAVALARCAGWFNPLIHVAAHYLRVDQELACDAAVVAAHPTARRTYAEALLKTQLAGRPLPLGCYWPAQAAHPLAQRIGLLASAGPKRAGGAAAVALLALATAWTAWAARPPQVVFAAAPVLAEAAPRPVVQRSAPPTAKDAWPALRRMTHLATAEEAARQSVAPDIAAVPQAPPQDPPAPDAEPRLMPAGLFGPARKVHAAAYWSSVEPGSAVRVVATMTDPQGIPLTTDLTAFGSQSWYRIGYISRNASRYKLFTSVVQEGQRLRVTAGLNPSFRLLTTGSIELGSGETGTIRLPGGQRITVTPFLRPESPDEVAATHREGDRAYINVERVESL